MKLATTALFCFALLSSVTIVSSSREDSWSITMDYNNVFFMDRLWYFRRATRRWARVIRGDMSDRPGPTHIKTRCGPFPDKIDDLYVCASYDDFDGRGGFLAASGALLARSDEQWQPYAGVMYFDRKDMAWLRKRRNFRNLVFREMAHVIGLSSTIWQRAGVAGSPNLVPPCPYYGPHATAEWQAISGCNTSAPTETNFPQKPNVQCNYWSSKCMPGEIMTANSDTLRSAALSRVTVGSLHDMNFAVDYKAANKYTKNDLNPACVCENHNHAISHRNLEDQTTTHSTISKRALQDAASIGKDLLAKMGQDDDENKSDFVGDYGVFVLYEEDGEVFGIHVKNDP